MVLGALPNRILLNPAPCWRERRDRLRREHLLGQIIMYGTNLRLGSLRPRGLFWTTTGNPRIAASSFRRSARSARANAGPSTSTGRLAAQSQLTSAAQLSTLSRCLRNEECQPSPRALPLHGSVYKGMTPSAAMPAAA